jgi:hypothetical protein
MPLGDRVSRCDYASLHYLQSIDMNISGHAQPGGSSVVSVYEIALANLTGAMKVRVEIMRLV